MSALLTPAMARLAVSLVQTHIDYVLDESGFAKRSALAVAVLDPLTGEELFTTTFGKLSREEWTADYEEIALAKARLAFRLKMSCRAAQQHPQLFQEGDTKHRGGIFHNGIAIGVSGVESYIEEMIALQIAASCEMLCRRAFEEVVTPSAGNTVTG